MYEFDNITIDCFSHENVRSLENIQYEHSFRKQSRNTKFLAFD